MRTRMAEPLSVMPQSSASMTDYGARGLNQDKICSFNPDARGYKTSLMALQPSVSKLEYPQILKLLLIDARTLPC